MRKIKKQERILLDAGFRRAYQPPEKFGAAAPISRQASRLSNLKRGQVVKPKIGVRELPAGMSEARLLFVMDQERVGRPSTVVEIVVDLLRRNYVQRNGGHFTITGRGRAVEGYLSGAFPQLFALSFSRKFEEMLDQIATGKRDYVDVIAEVWALVEAA